MRLLKVKVVTRAFEHVDGGLGNLLRNTLRHGNVFLVELPGEIRHPHTCLRRLGKRCKRRALACLMMLPALFKGARKFIGTAAYAFASHRLAHG